MSLIGAVQPSGTDIGGTVSTGSTFAAPGNTTLTHDLAFPAVVMPGVAYVVRATSAGWGTAAGNLRVKAVEITYVLPGGYNS